MKSPITKVKALGALFLTVLVQADTQPSVEPRSGIIVSGNRKVWFDGNMTRTESYGSLSLISVMSDHGGWVAYPELNRVSTNALQMPSYPEQVRTFFISQTTNRERLAEEKFLGLPCWRYGWVETNLPAKFAAAFNDRLEVWHLFLANPAFPLGLRWGHVGRWNTNSDVREVTLDVPIPQELFELPKGFKLTQKFQLPKRPFDLLLRQACSSPEWGSSGVTTTSFSCDGERILETQTVVDRTPDGERTTGPTERVRGFDEEIRVCEYGLDGLWGGLRKTGTEEMLGFTADILAAPNLDQRFWIIDHPALGTFCVRWVMGGKRPLTNEVVRIWVGEVGE